MKTSISFVIAIMLFVVLGCSMLSKKDEKVPTPDPSATKTGAKETPKPADTSSSGSLSMANYDQIKNGMSHSEVVKILGSDGTETRSSSVGKIELKSYKWEGEKYQRVYVNFRDDKVNSKTQSGLSGSSSAKNGDADITMSKYEEIKTDMSFEDVVKIIGSNGEQTRNSKIGSVEISSYRWKGASYSNIFATFKDNKLTSKSQAGLK